MSARMAQIIAVLGLMFLSFVGGAVAHKYKLPGGVWIERALDGAKALQDKRKEIAQRLSDIERMRKKLQIRMLANEPGAYPGYTLISVGADWKVILTDMSGKSVHEWRIPMSSIWKDPPHVPDPVPEALIMPSRAHVFPNGDLLLILYGLGDTPYGYGLVKLDKDSKLIWARPSHAHHDFDFDAEGNIYVLEQEFMQEQIKDIRLAPPYLIDYVMVLSPDGKPIRRINLLESLLKSPYAGMASRINGDAVPGDIMHTNTLKFLPQGYDYKLSKAKPGKLIISLRESNIVGILDPETDRIDWAITGPWRGQHAPRFLPNGNIALIDNLGLAPHHRSRVLEYDPVSKRIVRQFTNSHFYGKFGGDLQLLPNGNYLVGMHRGVLEITPGNEVVWQIQANVDVFSAMTYRYSADQVPFLKETGESPAP